MITQRRKEQQKTTRTAAKKPSTADRSIATGRAKRDAAQRARRGISNSVKPTQAEVKKQVERQVKKSTKAAQVALKKASNGRIKQPTNSRKGKKVEAGEIQAVTVRQPTKKAMKAAVTALKGAGYDVPQGMKVIFTLEPTKQQGNQTKKGNNNNNNNNGNGKKKAAQNNNGNGNNNNGNRKSGRGRK